MPPVIPDLDIQISIECEAWADEKTLLGISSGALLAAAAFLTRNVSQPFPAAPPEVSLVFADDASIRVINAEWRNIDKPTNVLSFPAYPIKPGDMPGPMLGDIIFAHETISREAVELEKSFNDHLTHLLVHGFLHLFGYDHMETRDAEEMEALETGILAAMGLSDPYAGQEL